MKQKELSKWIKGIIIIAAVIGLLFCFWIVPSLGNDAVSINPELHYMFYPCLIFIWITAIPFYMFDTIDLEVTQKEIRLLSKRIEKINIHFKKYGLYPNENPFLTIDIADNIEIINLHREIQKLFSKLGKNDDPDYFAPGIWKPDCQLTVSFDKTKLAAAVNYLSGTTLPFDGQLQKIGVIEFHPAKQLFSYTLS